MEVVFNGQQGLVRAHMAVLADYCLAGYGGRETLTEAFILGLHKALFPRNYQQAMATPQINKPSRHVMLLMVQIVEHCCPQNIV